MRVFEVASASLDRRSYRGLILANGLRILLASDPDVPKGAASMNVQVGYMSDPLPGLAHFCEHMLFLGTKPFPDEDAFERLVGSAGGSNNAYTAAVRCRNTWHGRTQRRAARRGRHRAGA